MSVLPAVQAGASMWSTGNHIGPQGFQFGMRLHPYQERVIDDFRQTTCKRVVVALPTGAGKTVIALRGIVPELPAPIAWITHRAELAAQVRRYRCGVHVQMIQSFKPRRKYSAIIIDEAHHVCAEQYQQLFDMFPKARFVALTATPYRMDGQGLGNCGFTSIIYGPDVHELTKMGFLCPARIYVPSSESQLAWTPEAATEKILSVKFHKGIAYCNAVLSAEALAEQVSSRGCPSTVIDSTMPMRTRRKVERQFRSGKLKLLCNHTIFTEGYDVPNVDLVVLNRRTESRCLWRQMTGRGLRNATGKKHCTVLDLAGNGLIHGSIYDNEIFDLAGTVTATKSRALPVDLTEKPEPKLNDGEDLIEWAPPPKPVAIIESLQRLKLKSPLHRLLTASHAR